MIADRLRFFGATSAPTMQTMQMSSGHRVTLSRANGLISLGIRAYSSAASLSSGVRYTSYLGDAGEDGRYHFPIHFHKRNYVSGEMLAEAMLRVAAQNSAVSAEVEGGVLRFSSTKTVALFPDGFLRDGSGVIYTVMFRMRAPTYSGSSLNSGLVIKYDSGTQAITKSGTFTGGETVQFLTSSSSSKRINGMSVVSTGGAIRELDLDSFGFFFGTPTEEEFEPYAGEFYSFSLSAPLRTMSTSADIAYPLQGYVERVVMSRPFQAEEAVAVDVGSSLPTYRIALPEDLWDKTIALNCFSLTTNQSSFLSNAFWAMRTEDGRAIDFTAKSTYKTPESFLTLFQSLGAELLWLTETPVIERFEPIRPKTVKGDNYLNLQTKISPFIMYFTYV